MSVSLLQVVNTFAFHLCGGIGTCSRGWLANSRCPKFLSAQMRFPPRSPSPPLDRIWAAPVSVRGPKIRSLPYPTLASQRVEQVSSRVRVTSRSPVSRQPSEEARSMAAVTEESSPSTPLETRSSAVPARGIVALIPSNVGVPIHSARKRVVHVLKRASQHRLHFLADFPRKCHVTLGNKSTRFSLLCGAVSSTLLNGKVDLSCKNIFFLFLFAHIDPIRRDLLPSRVSVATKP